jgi:hypothetical protein
MFTYARAIVGMNALSILWWTMDLIFPRLGWMDRLIPVYLAAIALPIITVPLWLTARSLSPTPVGRLTGAAVVLGLAVNVFGILRSLGVAVNALM